MKIQKIVFYFLFFYFTLLSCGTKTIKDNSVSLKGPILIKYKITNTDSIILRNREIKMSFAIPQNITTSDGILINNIEKGSFQVHPFANKIVAENAFSFHSYNFNKGSVDKSRAAMDIQKGTYCEDTYVCKDTGVFWFGFVPSPTTFRFWTKDGKYYSIPVTVTFDVPDMHTEMLIRYCPSIEPYLGVLTEKGFGYYCFKVVP